MSENTTLEIIAPTVEEALAQGLAQLGLTADAVSVEVLDSGSKGLFGLGGRQVRVRLTVNPPAGYAPRAPLTQPESSKPKRKEAAAPAKAEPKPAPAAKKQTAPETAAPQKSERAETDPLLDTTEAVVAKLIQLLGMKAQVSAHYDEADTADRHSIYVDVRGADLTPLIGRQAETLNAFQYIAALIVGKQSQQWVQLVVDVEGYRARREKQVKQLALKMVEQVIKTGRKAALEPMTASERRAIHIELRGHAQVETESAGEEPHRKVVILPKK